MIIMTEVFISPKQIHEKPEKFLGVVALGNDKYTRNVHSLLCRAYPDWKVKLQAMIDEWTIKGKNGKIYALRTVEGKLAKLVDVSLLLELEET